MARSRRRHSGAPRELHHRGSDGQRVWVAPLARVGIGHARLSIIDLATGDQPITNEDEQIHAVVNGEFYDYERIQRELEGRGHRLRTRSDSEIVLHLYEDTASRRRAKFIGRVRPPTPSRARSSRSSSPI